MTNYEIIEKFESDKVKSSLDIAGGVFVETDLIHEIVKALRSQPCEDAVSRQAAIEALKEHRALFCDNTPDTFSKLSYAEKSRVDELDTAIATLVNLPSAQPANCSEKPNNSKEGE